MAKSAIAPVVCQAELGDAAEIATSHVRAWQGGYADVVSGEYLRSLDSDLAKRTLRWQTILLGAEAEGGFVLVGEIDSELVGFLSGGPCRDPGQPEPLGEVHACYVDPAHWRLGVGSALLAAGIERLGAGKYREAVLWVLADNRRARSFYEARGWVGDGGQTTFELDGRRYPKLRYRRNLL
jgi:ribosomal protein S18 acetylase RimI-like enzyme